uniref:C2H2-type domain-containing protein n=1 Tax=Romanomermis culicivorax TaxID=13658 RepID=A0A915I8N0_ROMCU
MKDFDVGYFFQCQECDAVFEKWLELLQHTNEMHQVTQDGQDSSIISAVKTGDSVENSDRKFFPHIQSFYSAYGKFLYLVSYSSTTWCHICNKHLATVSSRNLHMRIHTGERPFACNVCGKAFTQNVHLRSHISVHTGAKPHVCKLCNKGMPLSLFQ